MTYLSLPLAFMHPKSIVMHPPKSLAFSGTELYRAEDESFETERPAGATGQEESQAAAYVVMQSSGHRAMLDRVALFSRPVETILHMHSDFGTAGEIRYSLMDGAGNAVLEHQAGLAAGAGEFGIEMSWLKPGRYHLLVAWKDADEESAVMYQIEKLQ